MSMSFDKNDRESDRDSDTDRESDVFASEEENEKATCIQRLGCFLVVAFLAAGATVSLSVAFTGKTNPLDYFVPVDPPGYAEAVRWDATQGLDLLVENACDDSWTSNFEESIADWNKTNALNLRTQRVEYDYDCGAITGRLRVCNGDYGNTKWRGLNIVTMRMDHIVHSVSKLNDYHLKNERLQRLYTMCHELGHGFGLPHTDEDHFNMNRGDCMDYTERPWTNLRPGRFNLDLLVKMYGTPTRPRVEPTEAPAPTPFTPPRSPFDNNNNNNIYSNREEDKEKEKDKKEKKKKEEDDRQMFLRGLAESDQDAAFYSFHDYEEATKTLVDGCEDEYCFMALQDGYRIHVFKLLV